MKIIYLFSSIKEELESFPAEETFILAVFTTVFFSVVAHGVTARPLSELYARHLKSDGSDLENEQE